MSGLTRRYEGLLEIHCAIKTHGFFIQYVLGDADGPPWAYTIGFLEHDYPELVVLGLSPESAAGILHEVHGRIVACDAPAIGSEHAHDYAGTPFRLLAIPPTRWLDGDDLLLGCVHYYGLCGFPSEPRAAQLVWADPDRAFPWDGGVNPRLRRLQPLVGSHS
jgi:hypothetical protein